MPAPPAIFLVRPRADGRRILTGPTLPFPLVYQDSLAAMDYAHHRGRTTGGKVLVLDAAGDIAFQETIENTGPTVLMGYR